MHGLGGEDDVQRQAPFMVGALRVSEEMLERRGAGVSSCFLSRGEQKFLSERKFSLPRLVVVAMLRAPKAKARAIGGCE